MPFSFATTSEPVHVKRSSDILSLIDNADDSTLTIGPQRITLGAVVRALWSPEVGVWFYLTTTDLQSPAEEALYRELNAVLGHPWEGCVLDRLEIDRSHPWFPGSRYSITYTLHREAFS